MKPLRLSLHVALLFVLILAGPARAEAPRPTMPDLYAVLWQQTSAEYKALCLQAFQGARQALEERARTGGCRMHDGRLVQETLVREPEGKLRVDQRPLALVLDLDETVLDNSGFQAWLLREGRTYQEEDWVAWTRFQARVPEARKAVPGVLAFLREAQDMGYTPIYLTNRDESSRADTLALLEGLGLGAPDLERRLILKDEQADPKAAAALVGRLGLKPTSPEALGLTANSSDKAGRRVEVQERYQVVGWFGDNLYDFPLDVRQGTPAGTAMLEARDQAVQAGADRWGNTWFILPNPMYGSWLSGSTIPRQDQVNALQDWGFGTWKQARAPR